MNLRYCLSDVIRFLFFLLLLENIFVHKKCTKIFYTNIILHRKIFSVGWLPATHKHFPNCCCLCILVYVVASNTTSSFSQAISLAHGAISSINAHHTQLVKFSLCENYFTQIFFCQNLTRQKMNYSTYIRVCKMGQWCGGPVV